MHIKTISSPLAKQRHYVLATDGACKGNPGTGGWGVIIQLKDGAEVIRQSALAAQGEVMISTNNQMELMAVVEGLKRLAEDLPIVVRTDSEYVVKGATEWLDGWQARGWRGSSGPVKNRELWENLDQLISEKQVE